MAPIRVVCVVLFVCIANTALAQEMVPAPGSSTEYPAQIETKFGNKKIKLVLTGTAMRKRAIFNVYAVASYIQDGVKVNSAEEIAAAECPKQFHLVMERSVSGQDVAAAFRANIRANHAEPAFEEEIQALSEALTTASIERGDHIWLTHIPGVGLHVNHVGKSERTIKNPKFSRAVWDIYLGKNSPLGETVKRGLSSRL